MPQQAKSDQFTVIWNKEQQLILRALKCHGDTSWSHLTCYTQILATI